MPRALVAGGSLAGLFAANMMCRAGWRVRVFERSGDELASRGAGIVTHPELFAALRRCGIDAENDLGVTVDGRVVLDQSGAVIAQIELPQLLTSWGHMYRRLRQSLPPGCYENGVTVASIDSQQGILTARRGSDLITEHGDVIVIADGIRSSLRNSLAPLDQPEYAGYIAWRGLVDEDQLSSATHASLFGKFGFCLPDGEQMLGYPVAGANDTVAVGRRRYNFVWYRPADAKSELNELLTDQSGRQHPYNIAPNLIREGVIKQMREAAEDHLAPQFAEVVRRTEQPFMQPIYDLVSRRLAFDRAVLIGDAAFVARPHVGMGVTKAAEDASALVDALIAHSEPQVALKFFESERLLAGEAVVGRARHLGAYMQAQIASVEERAMATRYRTPRAVMCETALTAHAAARVKLDHPA
jgi:2-polyprenyl-6-methoxyphenol hydroxylase-like FAD-dependent oxidoreductase